MVRLRLFRIRDGIRRLKIDNGTEFDDKAFALVEGCVSNMILLMPYLDYLNLIETKSAILKNTELRDRSERRRKILESCALPNYEKSLQDIFDTGGFIMMANSAGWFIYLIPIFLLIATVRSWIPRGITTIKNLVVLNEHDLRKLYPAVNLG